MKLRYMTLEGMPKVVYHSFRDLLCLRSTEDTVR